MTLAELLAAVARDGVIDSVPPLPEHVGRMVDIGTARHLVPAEPSAGVCSAP